MINCWVTELLTVEMPWIMSARHRVAGEIMHFHGLAMVLLQLEVQASFGLFVPVIQV